MNKLFTKVAALTLGVAMAAGVGVALGSAKVSEVKATEAAAYTLDGTHQETGTSYNGDNEVTQSNVTWIVNGNVNQTPWRIGGKNTNGLDVAGTIRKIQSQSAVTTEDVSKVVVSTALPSNNSLSPTAVSLKVGTGIGGSQTSTVSGTFGNTITFERPTSADWSSKYFEIDFTMPQNNTGTQKYFQVSSVVFYYESTTPRGTLEITQVPHILKVGSSFTPGMNWTPASGTSATISESEFSSSDEEVLSKDGNAFSALKAGYATITLSATDSLSEQYSVVSHKVYVTNDNAFDVGDKVAIIASDVTMELSGISDTSTPYGTGAAYENNPAGSFELEVESGSIDGSFAFKHTSGYLNWSTGNSLRVTDSKSDNSSWYVIDFDSYEVIKNCADETREIWWNNGSPRFACYTNKTPESDGYNAVSVYKISDTPVSEDWSDAQKTALETALHGYLPPYFGELAEELTTTENSAVFTVSGYHSGEFATKLGDGWDLVGDNNYMKVGDNYYLTASIYEYGVRLPVGNYSEFTFTYHEGQPVQNYTVTYTAGQGTGDNYVVSDVEAGSSHELVTFETAEFTAPEGQQFKGWQVGNDAELRDAGYEVTVDGDVTVTAIYEEIPAQKFTITYKSGYGTGDDIVISDVEAGSAHVLKTFDETQFVAPAGQQFKGWRVGSETELRDPGYEITNIQADVNIFANYEDIPVTDWSEEFLNEYTSRFGNADLPPFVDGALAGDENSMYWEEGYPFGYVVAEGDFTQKALTAFVNAWTFVGDVDTGSYIFMDKDMNAFVDIMLDDGYTVLLFTTIGDVALDTTGVKTEYFVGDAVDTTNLRVHPVLMNGAVVPGLTLPQNPYWSVSPSTFTEAGEQSVTVTVTKFFTTDIELTYDVTVTAVVAESISVSGQATKTSYNVGEEWSAEGLVVTAHYNNGTEADVTDQVTWSFDPAETAVEVTSVSAVAHLGDLSSDAVVFDVVVEQSYDADTFAKELLEMVAPICENYDGKKNNKVALKTVWDTMSQRYSTLSNEEKAKVIAAAAKTDGTDLEKAMAFYNYACKKYGLTKFIEGRSVQALVAEHETGNSILPIVVIVASSVAAITAIGVVIALKRRKALLAK